MIKSSIQYLATDKVRDLVEDNNQLLLVLNRFHVPFGFGDKTVCEICEEHDIDCPTFLAIADLISGKRFSINDIELSTMLSYLREAHSYILDFRLPDIRETLVSAVHQQRLDDVAVRIISFFDEYADEVHSHMEYENNVVFPYIESLLRGDTNENFKISDFASKHESVVTKLNELKDIFLQHYSIPNTRMLNRALFNIAACGEDLVSHCEIENIILVPVVEALEKKTYAIKKNKGPATNDANNQSLSQREKEIIRLVAHGLPNKEIADKLCLSFHTITTYRKNISAKLNIHSTAALTIFAILHGIVNPEEIELK